MCGVTCRAEAVDIGTVKNRGSLEIPSCLNTAEAVDIGTPGQVVVLKIIIVSIPPKQ